MSDISNLTLTVDSSKARRELSQFNSQLNKTGFAGQKLLNSLKSLGVTVRIFSVS